MQKIVCIVGPTAVGKTDLAFKTAHRFDGELISADSIQVYKGLDIISGKDIPKDSKFTPLPELSKNGYNTGFFTYNNVPIFLLDIVDPTSSFSVSQFQNLATKSIEYIAGQNKLPVIVGGTGFYVDAILNGIETSNIEPNLKLRSQLEKLSVLELQEKLQKLNVEKFSSMNESDRNNKRRLIRRVEIAQSNTLNHQSSIINHQFDSLVIGLTCEKEVLKQRIDKRVDERLKNGGLEEVEKLYKNYDKLSQQVKDANGYKQLFVFLKNETNFEEAIYRWKISEYRHAKNQMTWFRKYGNVKWFDIAKKDYQKDIENSLKNFLV